MIGDGGDGVDVGGDSGDGGDGSDGGDGGDGIDSGGDGVDGGDRARITAGQLLITLSDVRVLGRSSVMTTGLLLAADALNLLSLHPAD